MKRDIGQINIKLDKDFRKQANRLIRKYGDKMAELNGFAGKQLGYTEFIDNFVDKQTVADASIDGNANVGTKDICSLLSEMNKPHSKLLAFNKIYYELKKKYGKQEANKWLQDEWVGRSYMHDAYSSSTKPYCFSGDTEILTKSGIVKLKDAVGKDIRVLNKNGGWEAATVKRFGRDVLWKLTLERYGVVKEIYTTQNHKWFVGGRTERDLVQTKDLVRGMRIPCNVSVAWGNTLPSSFGVAHGFYHGDGDHSSHSRANFCGDKTALIPYFGPMNVTGCDRERVICGMPKYFKTYPPLDESPNYLYGWLAGYFAADGSVDEHGRCTIASAKKEDLEYVRNVLCVLGMPVNAVRFQDRVSNLTGKMGRVYILTLSSECLKEEFFIRPAHRNRWKKAQGKKRAWIVRSVECTNVVDDVYCAVAEKTHSFTLDGNVLTHNCYAYDIDPLVNKGLFFVDRFNAQPPKHLTTFTDFVGEFVSYTSNRTSGACGLPSFLIYSFYFWKKDCESGYCISSPEYYRDQEFQRIIYKLNQPYLRVNQSAFTNFSIFDRPYLEALFGGKEYPDGSFIIDYIDDLIDYQKHFMEIVSKIRTENVMTFPVLTYALLRKDGKFVDEDFAKWCCEHNMKWGDSNFFISDNVTSLSNCCFSGDTEVLVKSHSKVYLDTLKNLSSPEYASARRDMTVFHNGSWMAAKLIKLPKRQMYKVTTSNNKEIVVTDNHIHPTLQGDKATTDLTTDDYIMFNCRTLDTYPECDRKLTYEQGFLIGMYLGDGSISKSVVNLSLNAEKYSKSIDIINRALRDYKIEATPRLGNEYNKVYPVTITSNALVDAIREWVGGAYANVKTLNLDCLTQSRAFRSGILDGYYLTDGGNSNRIYTTSKKLAKQIEALCTSLGKHTIIDMSDRTNEPVVIRGSVYKRNYPLYCIRWYEDVNKRTYKNIYEVRNNSTYFKVASIEPVKYDDEFVYCFEMQRDTEPYFTLPNGMITHNCRLVSDIDNLG